MKYKRAIVVGASSGIGRELVRNLCIGGCRVAAIARREDRLRELAESFGDQVLPFVHDVTHFDEVPALFQEICKALGGLDLVIYCSGVMPEVAPSEFNFEKDRQMVDVNLLGAIAWLNRAADRFQHVKQGTIIGIGSVAGDRGRSGQPVYNATKAALATFLEALRNRVTRYGVTVVTIKPGPVKTEMTSRLAMRGMMEADEAARIILERSHRPGEYYLKPTHRLIFAIIKRIPGPIFRRLNL